MRDLVQVLVLGLIAAGIYGMFAVGIVLVHRGTRVLTFAGGEVGTVSLYVAAFFVTDHGAPWAVGAVVAVLFAAVLGVAFEFLLVRRSVDADPVVISILTVALAVTLLAVELQTYGASPKILEAPVRQGIDIAGVVVTPVQIAAVVVAAVLGFGLQAALRRTDFGLGILAAADDPAAARLVGVPLSKVCMSLWAGSFALAALAGLLVEPTVGAITPGYASTLYLDGLAAAVIGRLTSLPGAVAGAVVIGIAESAATRYLHDWDIPGMNFLVVLVVLLVALMGRAYLPDLTRRLHRA
ncbi:MAG: branched-chain amino acid ABC transporter permease, partial [Actinomycetota bacterium]|nr:branched-chain amino acid ABC transporter permease [Actinomycetota bacterium]